VVTIVQPFSLITPEINTILLMANKRNYLKPARPFPSVADEYSLLSPGNETCMRGISVSLSKAIFNGTVPVSIYTLAIIPHLVRTPNTVIRTSLRSLHTNTHITQSSFDILNHDALPMRLKSLLVIHLREVVKIIHEGVLQVCINYKIIRPDQRGILLIESHH
jgi:hypothetical protein